MTDVHSSNYETASQAAPLKEAIDRYKTSIEPSLAPPLDKIDVLEARIDAKFQRAFVTIERVAAQVLEQQEDHFAFDQNKEKMRIWVSFVNSCLSCGNCDSSTALRVADICITELELRFKI